MKACERGSPVPADEPATSLNGQPGDPGSGTGSPEGTAGLGDPETVALLERAIATCSQIEAVYEEDSGDEPRVFCPAAIGVLHGDRNLLVLQISGESASG